MSFASTILKTLGSKLDISENEISKLTKSLEENYCSSKKALLNSSVEDI